MIKNLKSLRQEKNVSQQKLADAVLVSQQSINKYENHNVEPDIEILIRLANYFDTSVDYLIGNTNIKKKICSDMDLNSITPEERELIINYRVLNRSEKDSILFVVKNYINKNSVQICKKE